MRARVRRGLSGVARRSRLAWTGEEQLRLALAAARMGTFEWDLRSHRGTMSPELEAIHGLAPGEFDGSAEMLMELVHPDDRDVLLSSFAEAAAGGGSYESVFRIVLPSGGCDGGRLSPPSCRGPTAPRRASSAWART